MRNKKINVRASVRMGNKGFPGFFRDLIGDLNFSLQDVIQQLEKSETFSAAKREPLSKSLAYLSQFNRAGRRLTGREAATISSMTAVEQAVGADNMWEFVSTFESEADKQNEVGLTWAQEARENFATHFLPETNLPESAFSRVRR